MIRAIVIASVIAACAAAGGYGAGGDASNAQDAPKTFYDGHAVTGDGSGVKMDGAIQLDAFVPKDAPKPPDAAGGGFCTDNTMCISGECCWVAVCIPGTAVGSNLCFPM